MFELSVGQDVRLSFDVADLSGAGFPVLEGLLARGVDASRVYRLSCQEVPRSVGELGNADDGFGDGARLVLEEGSQVWRVSGGGAGFAKRLGDAVDVPAISVVEDRGFDQSGPRPDASASVLGSGEQGTRRGDCASGRGAAVDERVCGAEPSGGGFVSASAFKKGPPRGPNYERNKANRERKKAAAAARKREVGCGGERKGYFDGLDEEKQRQLRESRAELLMWQNKRKIREEKQLVSKAEHGLGHLNEVVRLLKISKACRELVAVNDKTPAAKKDSAIAGWAQTVASASAGSIADSVPKSMISLSSVSSGSAWKSKVGSVKNHAKQFDFQNLPITDFESELRNYDVSLLRMQEERAKLGRALCLSDCLRPESRIKVSADMVIRLAQAEYGDALPEVDFAPEYQYD